jgi:hypothetical protein
METTSSKQLYDIMNEIRMIYIDSQNFGKKGVLLEKKLQNYTKGNLLIDQADQLIEKLEHDVQNLDMTKADKSNISKVKEYVDLLSRTNPRFDEILHMVEQLRAISAGLPKTAEAFDNIDQEVIYEEFEVTNE